MERVLLAVGIALVVALVAWALQRRPAQPPSQRRWAVPDQLDRADFERPGAPLLVAVFSSATCDACKIVAARAQDLASADVVVQEVEFGERRDLHARYHVETVPLVVVADRQGVVRASFVGTPDPAQVAEAIAKVTQV
ncbi:MAG: thioredoxin family protein [Acidimicrobiia bacterium]|nr:thioredoxin family protein [Acidimicrobiia bacterium]